MRTGVRTPACARGVWSPREFASRIAPRALVLLGSLLLTLTLGPPASAVTSVTVDGHPSPVILTVGETFTVRFDVSRPGTATGFQVLRDLAGTAKYDPMDPLAWTIPSVDGGIGDLDPAPGKVAVASSVDPPNPAGRYLFHAIDGSDGSTFDLPVTIVPRPQPQAISGRVAVVSAGGAGGAPPPHAIIWAYRDLQTPAASADMQADGSYTLPLPPGTYIVFAEWYGSLRSQRQVITVAAGQQLANINLPLLHGQEVGGTLRDDQGKPMANAPVQATPVGGTAGATPLTTQTLADGSYVLVLPAGQYNVAARGTSRVVTVADEPVDGIDFPPAAPGPPPAVGTIITVAGNGLPGFGGDGGPAVNARLFGAAGIAVDKAGNVYLTPSRVSRIRKVDPMGQISTIAGSTPFELIRGLFPLNVAGFSGDGGPATAAQLNTPQWVAVDAAGNLYIADLYNNRVRKVDASTGVITTVAGSGPAGNGKGGFAGDGGPATAALLNAPQGLALDAADNLYIADLRNHRVRKVGLDGIITTVAGGGKDPVTDGASATSVVLGTPVSLAVDLTGNLYIADPSLLRILKVSPSGTISVVAGTGRLGYSDDGARATAAQLSLAVLPGLAVDSAGNLFFVDANRVRKIGLDGLLTTVAGSGQPGFAGDGGPARAARLSRPTGLAIDATGNLYIGDSGNGRIRKVIGSAAPGVIGGR